MSAILSAVPQYGLEAVSVACEMALEERAVSQRVILNDLTRLAEEPEVPSILVSEKLRLQDEPRSNCAAYDILRSEPCCAKAS